MQPSQDILKTLLSDCTRLAIRFETDDVPWRRLPQQRNNLLNPLTLQFISFQANNSNITTRWYLCLMQKWLTGTAYEHRAGIPRNSRVLFSTRPPMWHHIKPTTCWTYVIALGQSLDHKTHSIRRTSEQLRDVDPHSRVLSLTELKVSYSSKESTVS